MSVYRFKSRETGDLVMLSQHGKRLLEILGKDPSGPGVIQPGEMPGAVQAIRAAVAQEEALNHAQSADDGDGEDQDAVSAEEVSLRLRSAPFIEMLNRCEAAGVDIVWGV